MTISLNEEGCKRNNITIAEALLLICYSNDVNFETTEASLISKGYITAKRDENYNPIGWRVTNLGTEVLNSSILDAEKTPETEDRLTNLAKQLKGVFPKGKKDGTNLYWAEGVALIVRRLKLFFKKYGDIYSDEDIVKAAQNYIRSFNGNYQYMKVLKYFIFKEKLGANREVEGESELINYIENADQEENLKNDWTLTLR